MPGLHAAFGSLGFRHIESYWLFYFAIAWLVAWGGYALYRVTFPGRPAWSWDRIVGVALVLFPFVEFTHDFIESISFVLDPNSVVGTVPAWAWWRAIRRRAWKYVLVPLLGLFLVFGHAHWRRLSLPARVKDTLVRIDAWPRRGWTRDIVNGFGLFVLVWFAYVLFIQAVSGIRQFDTGDESAVFNAITPGLALGLSITAGITEEFLFRGIVQTRLARVMPLGVAIALQSLFFGLIHSGYGTIGHIVAPMFFGLLMGIVVWRLGLWPAIIVHTLLDLVIFLGHAARNGDPWTIVLAPWIFLAGVALPVAYYGWRWYERQRDAARRAPPEERNP